jgi:hypothetical protein
MGGGVRACDFSFNPNRTLTTLTTILFIFSLSGNIAPSCHSCLGHFLVAQNYNS